MFPSQYKDIRQPDILDCIANLSNDEVFTPPTMANKVLDLLPKEIWTNEKLKFLDPCCKTGIFLREIARRLMEGLKEKFPDEQERREHIFKNQIYGIALTTLTALMSRRSVYYSKDASSKYSVIKFKQIEGNVFFKLINHSFKNGNCEFCEIAESEEIGKREMDGSLENHAYNFIHLNMEKMFNMKFDVIVGNPPYQLGDGGFGASAMPIYHKFIEQAKKLNPRYMAFIIPSRWFAGGKGLDEFREKMLNDKHIKELVDYPNASDCFPGVEIKGGVCYFVWDAQHTGDCNIKTILGDKELPAMKRSLNEYETFIRFNQAIPILRKVQSLNEETLDKKVSSRKPFGFATNFKDFDKTEGGDKVKIYANKNVGFVFRHNIEKGNELVEKYKVLLPKANEGSGEYPNRILSQPIVAEPPSVCTETYIVIGSFDNINHAKNFEGYIKTRFFRFLVALKKVTQDTTSKVYAFVPDIPMNEVWTDEKLYARYGINEEEQKFIESMIKEMN